MRIVIDLEACQSPHSRHRGIGRYSMALAREMVAQGRGHEYLVALNGTYEGTTAAVRSAFDGLLPAASIVEWHATVPPTSAASPAERRACEIVRESFLASLHADVVHVASLFEYGTYSFPTIGSGPGRHRTALTLYDLIPHVHRRTYLHGDVATREYDRKLEEVKRADVLLAISEASRQEALEHLGIAEGKVVNISSAANPQFTTAHVPLEREVALRAHYRLLRPFVMYTGGIDPRKNIPRLIEAWSCLPPGMREGHQLALVCAVRPDERAWLDQLAAAAGLAAGELIVTGFVPDHDLADLYRLCELFVFPSLHEGFGLPALEAMRCGAAVIGADNSSIPEVIGRDDALFDANSSDAIRGKIEQLLGDRAFRMDLARHGLRQAEQFSWARTARAALDAMEDLGAASRPTPSRGESRPKLAYVAPLPPQRSGIADYAAELLPALARHYDIDAIVDQHDLDDSVRDAASNVRDARWFMRNAGQYDRILYHFGNSVFHEYMVPLLERHPGTVVLHDFFLSGMQANREFVTEHEPHWSRALYESHGWGALAQRLHAHDMTETILGYPANFETLREARGIIVHSEHARDLARAWYGPGAAADWQVIPLMREAQPRNRAAARAALGLSQGDILVCSFGILGPTKMNAHLLRAWKQSRLAADPRCRLVFVGENDGGAYGRELAAGLASCNGRVGITGWASATLFRQYLDAADVAVQLRTLSRGETSAAALDAMCHGLPLIANASGSMADLPRDAVILLDEDFSDADLVAALEQLRFDENLRDRLGSAGRAVIETVHDPARCARLYADAIEGFAAGARPKAEDVAAEVGALLAREGESPFAAAVAAGIAQSLLEPSPARRWLLDVTGWAGAPTELPAHLRTLIHGRAAGWRAEPVRLAGDGAWRYARAMMLEIDHGPAGLLEDDVVELRAGDVWGTTGQEEAPAHVTESGLPVVPAPAKWHADILWPMVAAHSDAVGVRRCFVDISELVRHDWQSGIQRVVKHWMLELLREAPSGMDVVPVYTAPQLDGYRVASGYLREAAGVEGDTRPLPMEELIVAPRAGDIFFALDLQPHFIADKEALLARWRGQGVKVVFMVYDLLPVALPQYFLPGAARHHERWLGIVAQGDLAICISKAVADELSTWLARRGGPAPAVRFADLGADLGERIATQGLPESANAVLQGMRDGPSFLMVGTLEPRKAHAAVLAAFDKLWTEGADCMLVIAGRPGWMVDDLFAVLRAHPESGRRLVWVDDASDEYLEALYRAAGAVIVASHGEGFGLPLVEAAGRGLPIIARDLPVFREVAGDHAHYFADDGSLADTIRGWIELRARGAHPRPEGMRWLTWAQSAVRLREILSGKN